MQGLRISNCLVRWLILAALIGSSVPALAAPSRAPELASLRGRLATVSVPFVEHGGRVDSSVLFEARLLGGTLFVTGSGRLVYALTGPGGPIVESFPHGNAQVAAGMPHVARVSSFVGADAGGHRAGLRTYEHVALGEVFPGIDIRLRATGANVEKIFTVRPGADPRRIAVRVEGARGLSLDSDGALVVSRSDGGRVAFTPPVAFQTIDGRQVGVAVRYALDASGGSYGFDVGRYDRTRPLVIDPLLQATYFGGVSLDFLHGLAIHPATGEIYIGGYTDSPDLLCTTAGGLCANGAQPTGATGSQDAFIARFSPDLTQLRQATYLGGSKADDIRTVIIDPANGDVVVAGGTNSADLPCATAGGGCLNGAQPAHATDGDQSDGFIARLSADLTKLKQATYFGGNAYESIESIAIHPLTGEIFAAGTTASTNLPCTTAGGVCAQGAQPLHAMGGGNFLDGFVARLSGNLTQLHQATYFGGNGDDGITVIAVHPANGNILIAGGTNSTNLACTTAVSGCAAGAQPAHAADNGGDDGFVAMFSADLTQLRQATYLGGTDSDEIAGLVVHPRSGEIIVAGYTLSTDLPCASAGPGCANGAQSAHGGATRNFDGFVARLSGDLTVLLQSTYLGGSSLDIVEDIAVHPLSGEIVVAGYTSSTDFPCTAGGCPAGAQSTPSASGDGFVARFSADLTRLVQATYVGGGDSDLLYRVAVHPSSGEVFAAGYTGSTNFPCTQAGVGCANGGQSTNRGFKDAVVVRLAPDLTFDDKTPAPFAFPPVNGAATATLVTSAPVQVNSIFGPVPVYVDGALGSAYCLSNAMDCSCNASGGFVSAAGTITTGQYVCVRHVSAPVSGRITETVFHAGGGAATFRVATGSLFTACSLDVDGNGAIDALTDGMILMRALFGLTGTAVTNGTIGAGATRSAWAQLQPYLNGNCGASFAP